MHCDTVRAALLDYLNSETGPVRAWAIRRHLAACAGCAQELASLHQFTATLRRADLVPPLSTPVAVPARRLPLRRALASAGAALLIVALFLLPTLYQNRRNAQNPGAAVAAALARVNTWHFAGWKLIDGKQVPWEVWGRRSPWLYYERVGDTTTWSDGRQRLRIFAPNPALKRPYGLVVKTSVDQVNGDLGFLEDPAYQALVNSRQAGAGFGDGYTHLYQQTVTLARFRCQSPLGVSSGVNSNNLYTISKRDWLPITYHLHFDGGTFARDTEYLGVRYDVDLPDAVLSPPPADGYSVVDFTPSAKHADGFRVVAEPVGMDAAGNVVIVARGWLGEDRLTPGSTFSLNVQPYNGAFSGKRLGQAVKYLFATNSSLPPGADIQMPFAPLEPLKTNTLPDTFLLTMSASPETQVRGSDLISSDGRTHPVTRTESLVSKRFHWRMPLPSKPVSSLLALLPPSQRDGFQASSALPSGTRQRSPVQAVEYNLAEQRRAYYFTGGDYLYTGLARAAPQLAQTGALTPEGLLNPDVDGWAKVKAVRQRYPGIFKKAEREFRAHSIHWQQRKLELLPTLGATSGERFVLRQRRIVELQLLADCYRKTGDEVGQDRTLRRLIRECQTMPQRGGLIRRQAEWSLRTGQFSEDVGYKGPG